MAREVIDFKYVPLSFISSRDDIEKQSLNTVIFRNVLDKFGELISIGELLDSTQYGYTASAMEKGNCKFLRITDINNGRVNWDHVPYCNCEIVEKYELSPKDVLIARTGNNISYLVGDNVPKHTVFASYLIRLTCDKKLLLPEYLYLFLNSYAFWPQILKKQRGALLQNVNAQRMRELLIPYCPLEDQKKLVVGSKQTSQTQGKVKVFLSTQHKLSKGLAHQKSLLKKLRQQILQEAIEGKLTADWRSQNPDVEPASKLLKRITDEKEQLIKDKKIKKQKPLPPISEEEKPLELPEGWEWCQPENLFTILSSKGKQLKSKDYKKDGKFPIVDQGKNLICGYSDLEDKLIKTSRPLIIFGDHTREIKFVNFNFIVGADGTKILNPLGDIYEKYLYFALKKLRIKSRGYSRHFKTLKNNLLPLPPLAEQKAIVAKVEKLLTLCDQLGAKIVANRAHAEALMQAVLKEAFSQGG